MYPITLRQYKHALIPKQQLMAVNPLACLLSDFDVDPLASALLQHNATA